MLILLKIGFVSFPDLEVEVLVWETVAQRPDILHCCCCLWTGRTVSGFVRKVVGRDKTVGNGRPENASRDEFLMKSQLQVEFSSRYC